MELFLRPEAIFLLNFEHTFSVKNTFLHNLKENLGKIVMPSLFMYLFFA